MLVMMAWMSELVTEGLVCLREGFDAYRPLDEQCGHGSCDQNHHEKFLGILQKDIAKCGCLYGVENLVAWALRLDDVEFNGMNRNETHDSPESKKKNSHFPSTLIIPHFHCLISFPLALIAQHSL